LKIYGFANVIPISTAVRSKRTQGDGGSGQQQYDPNQSRKDNAEGEGQAKGQPKSSEDFDQQKVKDAVAAFHTDVQTQAHGLTAVVEGQGPGLKIAVKDVSGVTLRLFSSDEFLRMRGVASQGARPRGKILDQKL
jgi:hypothetical protein